MTGICKKSAAITRKIEKKRQGYSVWRTLAVQAGCNGKLATTTASDRRLHGGLKMCQAKLGGARWWCL
jgi:hypothetical protein